MAGVYCSNRECKTASASGIVPTFVCKCKQVIYCDAKCQLADQRRHAPACAALSRHAAAAAQPSLTPALDVLSQLPEIDRVEAELMNNSVATDAERNESMRMWSEIMTEHGITDPHTVATIQAMPLQSDKARAVRAYASSAAAPASYTTSFADALDDEDADLQFALRASLAESTSHDLDECKGPPSTDMDMVHTPPRADDVAAAIGCFTAEAVIRVARALADVVHKEDEVRAQRLAEAERRAGRQSPPPYRRVGSLPGMIATSVSCGMVDLPSAIRDLHIFQTNRRKEPLSLMAFLAEMHTMLALLADDDSQ